MEALLETDPVLAGRTLTVARSPVYNPRGSDVRSLKEAVMRLGTRALGNLVMEVAMGMRVFRASSYVETTEALRRHSLFVAHLSRTIAGRVGVAPETAFLTGLMHELGTACCLLVAGDAFPRHREPPLEEVLPAILRVRAEVGEVVARAWNLPEEVTACVSARQLPARAEWAPLGACVSYANGIAIESGFAGVEEVDLDNLQSAMAVLSLSAEDIDAATAEAERLQAQEFGEPA
ncbi:MAG: HDOD domain-containing protein, partial [Myxococcota bacterium]